APRLLPSFPTRRSSDLTRRAIQRQADWLVQHGDEAARGDWTRADGWTEGAVPRRADARTRLTGEARDVAAPEGARRARAGDDVRSEEHTSELQSRFDLV